MNKTIETMLDHRSIRKFDSTPLTDKEISLIIQSAQSASTSSNIQAYSIIGIEDENIKMKIATLSGNQDQVLTNGHLLIFCADLHRHEVIANNKNIDVSLAIESNEKFMVSIIDTSLAAQNAALAAESMNLGICYIGGIRNNLKEMEKILKTPVKVIPLFGMCIGHKSQKPELKPRLPIDHVYHKTSYNNDIQLFLKELTDYDYVMTSYYFNRSKGLNPESWTEKMLQLFQNPRRMYIKEYLKEKKFAQK